MEDRHVILHDLVAHLPENLQHKINPEDHISFYAGMTLIDRQIAEFFYFVGEVVKIRR